MTIIIKTKCAFLLSKIYFILFCLTISSSISLAQENQKTTANAPAPLSVEILDIVSGDIPTARHNIEDVAKLDAWLDGVITSYSKKDELAGVTLSIIKGNDTLTNRGYGIRTSDTMLPVIAEETLFRIGSISKTFIWVSLMQLYEQEKISLDDPIDQYLPVSLKTNENAYEPILIKHLMSHSAGYEDRALGHLFVTDLDKVTSLQKYLETYKPARVRAPGKNTSYSNYGAGLAAIIIEKVSGQPFYDYVRDNITAPLGMFDTTYREPTGAGRADLPQPIAPFLQKRNSVAMKRVLDRWQDGTYFYITQMGPVGSMVTTARDMSIYMKMLLNSGSVGNKTILNPETVKLMQQTLLSMHSDIPGIAHGFMRYSLPGGTKGFGHGGNTIYFHANMIIIPTLDIGIFISTNGPVGHKLANDLPKLLVARYFGTSETPLSPPPNFFERGQIYIGDYMNNRHSYTGLDKLGALGSVISVSVTQDGYLLTTSGDKTRRWVEISPHLFKVHDGDELLTFSFDSEGKITGMNHPMGVMEFEKIEFFDGPSWFYLIISFGITLSVITMITTFMRRKNIVYASIGEIFTLGSLAIAAYMWVAFTIVLIFSMIEIQEMGNLIIGIFPSNMIIWCLNIAIIASVFTSISLLTLPKVWVQHDWTISRKIRHGLMTVVLMAMILTMYVWNVIGHNYY